MNSHIPKQQVVSWRVVGMAVALTSVAVAALVTVVIYVNRAPTGPAARREFAQVFNENCSQCHHATRSAEASLKPGVQRQFSGLDELAGKSRSEIRAAIRNGVQQPYCGMRGFAVGTLSNAEVELLVEGIRERWPLSEIEAAIPPR